ncbi:transporter substrate-binding domain-containing protein [Solwaraspora sp. WMMD791]|uniref:substrate-binding periplasmic protein n=1 Tax=Solwaraspora sp. WMMD791 TaxID=3016086 RepID=UPI00249BC23A|nr:transporter substrate-binding domain-containing protein [Solwaraspora sp. WMMD791]WFE26053.1 transporter substrate-binding domain-containing protein [Solwaraspora sp. WMMD791]
MRRTALLAGVILLLLAGCQWPQDAGTTARDVQGGVLRVGVSEAPPWTRIADDGTVSGAEAMLVRRLAQRLDARVEWHPGSESTLMAALKDRVLDLVIGGLDASVPWTEHASLTRPYVTMRTVVAVPADVPHLDDLARTRVAVPAGTVQIAALRGKDAVPVPVTEVTGREGLPVVVGQWRLAELGLRDTGHELAKHDHVWAVPPGENGWQVEVERFLLALSHGEIEALLVAAERGEGTA